MNTLYQWFTNTLGYFMIYTISWQEYSIIIQLLANTSYITLYIIIAVVLRSSENKTTSQIEYNHIGERHVVTCLSTVHGFSSWSTAYVSMVLLLVYLMSEHRVLEMFSCYWRPAFPKLEHSYTVECGTARVFVHLKCPTFLLHCLASPKHCCQFWVLSEIVDLTASLIGLWNPYVLPSLTSRCWPAILTEGTSYYHCIWGVPKMNLHPKWMVYDGKSY